MSIIPEDMDGDGLDDIVVSDRKGEQEEVFWLKNPGSGSSVLHDAWVKTWIADDLKETTLIDIADIDGDGVNEVIVPNISPSDERVLTILDQNAKGGWQHSAIKLPGTANAPKAVKVADINSDGRPDLVVSFEKRKEPASRGVVWLEHIDENWLSHSVSGIEGIKFDLNLVIDIDGDLDIGNTEENNNAQGGEAGLGLVWYENPFSR